MITASTGNHGAASAWAARRTQNACVVFLPEGSSGSKLALLESLGRRAALGGADVDEAKDAARALAAEQDQPFFEDGAEPAQFDGYRAIADELLEQLGEPPATVVVPVGNGALLSAWPRAPRDATVGVVAKEAPVMALSVAAGRPVPCDRSATFADGMAVRVAVPLAVEEMVAAARTADLEVSERALAEAVAAFAAAGLRVEGSAAASLAALDQLEPTAASRGADRHRPQHRRRALPPGPRAPGELPGLMSAPRPPLDITPEQREIQRVCRDFAAREIRPVSLAVDEADTELPRDVWEKAAAIGLTSFMLPEELGGGGMTDCLTGCIVQEELSHGCAGIGNLITSNGFFAEPLLALGTDAQQRRWLEPLARRAPAAHRAGHHRAGRGSDAASIQTTRPPGRRRLRHQRPEELDLQRRGGRLLRRLRHGRAGQRPSRRHRLRARARRRGP